MAKQTNPLNPELAFCKVCLKPVAKSEAESTETRDYVAYFCSPECYEKWSRQGAPAAAGRELPEPELQAGHGRSPSRDERVKRAVKQHPQRDEPRVDSVEDDELPPPLA